jgi:hypothetical protein
MRNFVHAGDILSLYDFVEEELVYVDAPLEGFLRARDDNRRFAFVCEAIVPARLWHWTLMPVDESHADIEGIFARATREPPREWLSIVEDRRTETHTLAGVWLGAKAWTPWPRAPRR